MPKLAAEWAEWLLLTRIPSQRDTARSGRSARSVRIERNAGISAAPIQIAAKLINDNCDFDSAEFEEGLENVLLKQSGWKGRQETWQVPSQSSGMDRAEEAEAVHRLKVNRVRRVMEPFKWLGQTLRGSARNFRLSGPF